MSARRSTESAITADIRRQLTRRGIYHVKLHGGTYQRRGLPDLLVVIDGRAFFLEVKRPGRKLTALQEHELGRCRDAGAVAEVATSWQEAARALGLEERQ